MSDETRNRPDALPVDRDEASPLSYMRPRHDPACASVYAPEWRCTCGLVEMRTAARKLPIIEAEAMALRAEVEALREATDD